MKHSLPRMLLIGSGIISSIFISGMGSAQDVSDIKPDPKKFDVSVLVSQTNLGSNSAVVTCEGAEKQTHVGCANMGGDNIKKHLGVMSPTGVVANQFQNGDGRWMLAFTEVELLRRAGKSSVNTNRLLQKNNAELAELKQQMSILTELLRVDYVQADALANSVNESLVALPLTIASDEAALKLITQAVISKISEKYELVEKSE